MISNVKRTQPTICRLQADLHKALRIAAIEEHISMNEAIKRAVEIWLGQRQQAGKDRRKLKR